MLTAHVAGHDFVEGKCISCGRLWRDIWHITTDNMPAVGTSGRPEWEKGWAHQDPGSENEAKQIMTVKKAQDGRF